LHQLVLPVDLVFFELGEQLQIESDNFYIREVDCLRTGFISGLHCLRTGLDGLRTGFISGLVISGLHCLRTGLSEDWAGLSEDWVYLRTGLSEDWVYLRTGLSEECIV
jgi:hypothetical protein